MDAFPKDFDETVRENRKKRNIDNDQRDEVVRKRLRQEICDALLKGDEYIFNFPSEAEFSEKAIEPFLEEVGAALPEAGVYHECSSITSKELRWMKGNKTRGNRKHKIVLTEGWI